MATRTPHPPRTPGPEPNSSEANSSEARTCTVHEGVQRLVQVLPRIMRGLRHTPRRSDESIGAFGPRHRSALALIREHGRTMGDLARSLDLTLQTVSGLVSDLEKVGFVTRSTDPADRRRTIVTVASDRHGCVDRWLDGASAPVANVLEKLSPEERAAFIRAMDLLDVELNATKGPSPATAQDFDDAQSTTGRP